MKSLKRPKFYFGGIDYYGINPRNIKLPFDMPAIDKKTSIAFMKKLRLILKRQIIHHLHNNIGKIRYIGNKIYIVVDVANKDPKSLFEYRRSALGSNALNRTNKALYRKWKNALNELWSINKTYPARSYQQNAKKFIKTETNIRITLVKDKTLVENIKSVLSHGRTTDLAIAALLCHWTPKKDTEIVKKLESLILHQNQAIRNNVSRSILVNYPHRIREIDIHKFLKQVQLPFHTDRNKALYVLLQYSKLPHYRKLLRQHRSYFKKLSRALMPNITQPAMNILENIREGKSKRQ